MRIPVEANQSSAEQKMVEKYMSMLIDAMYEYFKEKTKLKRFNKSIIKEDILAYYSAFIGYKLAASLLQQSEQPRQIEDYRKYGYYEVYDDERISRAKYRVQATFDNLQKLIMQLREVDAPNGDQESEYCKLIQYVVTLFEEQIEYLNR